ncbi:MAG: hypothetical protein LC104_01470 [Bacteroidales bacterium]|nr:hypothetical protein [Bacteroidales bacterium]
MTARTFIVNELVRSPEQGPEDRLTFTTGVNVIVGMPNTGKSKWLQMLNYLLVSEDAPADVFGEVVAAKYSSLKGTLTLAGDSLEVERRWDSNTPKNRIFVNGEVTNIKEFLLDVQNRLGIPVLHYPQGNPLGQRTWPELGWRSLYRHMYRRQQFWSDIADRQPESEQHACILQFCGLAEKLFSEEYGKLVEKQKRIIELQAQKEHFLDTLSHVSKDLLSAEEIGVGLTPQSLDAARKRVQTEIEQLQTERQAILAELTAKVQASSTAGAVAPDRLDKLTEELANFESRDEQLRVALERNQARLAEMLVYRASIEQEAGRLERAMKAGSLLADLKVTHCPACDQPVMPQSSSSDCYLCHRPMPTSLATASAARLEMEMEQTKAVLQEATEMVSVLVKDKERLEAESVQVRSRIAQIRSMLRPVRMAAATLLPPEIGLLDMKMGQKQEQIAQIDRVAKSLAYREVLAKEINSIQQETTALEREVATQSGALDFEKASDQLRDGMVTYLNAIKAVVPNAWTQKEPKVLLDERKARFLVGERKWDTQLGGTLSLYYLLAYHYALMGLVEVDSCHFPGFLALDFPAELDGASTRDTENFAVEPFVALLAADGFESCQVIAAGAAFENLSGANRIEFTKVWA